MNERITNDTPYSATIECGAYNPTPVIVPCPRCKGTRCDGALVCRVMHRTLHSLAQCPVCSPDCDPPAPLPTAMVLLRKRRGLLAWLRSLW